MLTESNLEFIHRNSEGKTPLMMACQCGDKDIFNLLLKAGANIHATTALGDTALNIAEKKGFQELALELVHKGASIRGRPPTPGKLAAIPK